ncbi:MAG: hypothetical protein H7A46_16325 [Verrucomicrobiales bacterium]|nr:hypothetical protein [Verrucomicrobiales bacterium]
MDKVEQSLAKLRIDHDSDHPEVQSAMSLQRVVQTQVSNRIDGLLQGLRANITAFQARYDLVSNQVEEARAAVAKEASVFSQAFQDEARTREPDEDSGCRFVAGAAGEH